MYAEFILMLGRVLGMSKGILKLARSGYDARTADDLNIGYDSDYATPKIFWIKHATPSSSPYYTDFTHNLGYVPSFFAMRNIDNTKWCHAMHDDLILLTYNMYFNESFVEADTSKFRVRRLLDQGSPSDVGTTLIAMFDPIKDDDVTYTPSVVKPYIAVAKESKDAKSGHPKDMHIDSRFDTFKIYKTGTITLNAPEVTTSGAGVVDTRSTYFAHNLGYIPFYTPLVPYNNELQFIYFNRSGPPDIPEPVNVSDLSDFALSNIYATSPWISERIQVYVTSTRLYLVFKREGYYGGETFPARTINMKYTIFYNKINETLDLL
jgi:hypothetical protein